MALLVPRKGAFPAYVPSPRPFLTFSHTNWKLTCVLPLLPEPLPLPLYFQLPPNTKPAECLGLPLCSPSAFSLRIPGAPDWTSGGLDCGPGSPSHFLLTGGPALMLLGTP